MGFEERIAFHRSRADLAISEKHWPDAEAELTSLVAIAPGDVAAWNNLGLALKANGKPRESVEAYARAAALAPQLNAPRRNLIVEMQRYLGFVGAIAVFKAIEFGSLLLPIPGGVRDALRGVALVTLIIGATIFYLRRRHQLPPETWHAYKSEMARTRRLRYGGLAFVFGGFLAFAIAVFILVLVPGLASDATVVLVIVAGFCWLIVARLAWYRLVAPRLQ